MEEGFKFDGKENTIPLDKFSRATGEGEHGNHPGYNQEVGRRLGEFKKDNPNYSGKDALGFVRQTVGDLRNTIESSRGTKVNDLFKSIAPAASDNTKNRMIVDPTKVQPAPKPQSKLLSQYGYNDLL